MLNVSRAARAFVENRKLKSNSSSPGRQTAPSGLLNWRPSLTPLEERAVPSATELDLTSLGSSGLINGALFSQGELQPAGCGVIQSFVRIQGKSGEAVEQGYNTDARPVQFDEKTAAPFTRSLPLSQVPQVEIGGVIYYEFVLDINESSKSPLLSLDALRIYLGATGNLTGYNSSTGQLAGLTPVYDMGNNLVMLNARLETGTGKADMFLDVPTSLFTGPYQYLYLYSEFGVETGFDGGFEQWAVSAVNPGGPTQVTSLSGFVFLDSNGNGVFGTGDVGLQSFTVTLTGTDVNGNSVSLTQQTGVNGYFSFPGLTPGTYSLTVTPLSSYANGPATVGTINGNPEGITTQFGMVSQIVLQNGDQGVNFDFAEEFLD